MSYDIRLLDPATRETIMLPEKHDIQGGTYAIGGTREAWLNVTYNYAKIFYRVMGEKGIRTIYGMTGLEKSIDQLGFDTDPDYWKATDGNARQALMGLLQLAMMRPDGIWDGD